MISALVARLVAAKASVPRGATISVSSAPISVAEIRPTMTGTASRKIGGTSEKTARRLEGWPTVAVVIARLRFEFPSPHIYCRE